MDPQQRGLLESVYRALENGKFQSFVICIMADTTLYQPAFQCRRHQGPKRRSTLDVSLESMMELLPEIQKSISNT